MSEQAQKETMEFQAEVTQLLDLMIHSLYSSKEIFLRELISNASDAADKLRFEALSDESLFEGDTNLHVFIDFDKEARTITVRDNGIGMNRQEVTDHIGTIAKSGTRQFFESISGDAAKDAHLIGQFGVGFYSAFIVADRVTLTTRRAGLGTEHGVRWESTGDGGFTLETVEKRDRGTEIVLYLREGEEEFLERARLTTIIHKYADHIPFPIRMPVEGEEKQGEIETVNQASALWTRPKSELTQEDYDTFYRHVAHDFEAPMATLHQQLEGKYEYTLLLYIPSNPPFDLWDRDAMHGVKLYVRRVFIMEGSEELMPRYLRFVRGIIDSSDLPLNVSRELLQHNPAVEAMKKSAIKRVLGQLEEMARDDAERYAKFWEAFGTVLKEGIIEDAANRERIAGLLRFSSTHEEGDTQSASLADYVARMPEGQKAIYYLTADSYAAASHSPHLEVFRAKGIEVLLLHDRIDEWVTSHLTEFDGKPLQSITKGELDLGDLDDAESKDEEAQKAEEEEFKPLAESIKKVLEDKVKEVRVTHRLTESPACLVSEGFDISTNLERILKQAGQEVPDLKPILEINPKHPLLARLKDEKDEKAVAEWSAILFDQAVLSEGGQLEDPAGFVRRINGMLV
ncbi:MAG TPA: molecular chaperone HtpG [Mariprofundaceae bacterium]|nr:molecular chaperone HtpG [Mariprofundaceae bacterium]